MANPVCAETSASTTPDVLTEQLERQPALRALKRLLVQRWELVTIEKLGRRIGKRRAVYRLHGPNGETVVAKRCLKERVEVERTIYQEFLPRVGLPAIQLRGLLEEPEGEYCWLFLEDAGGDPYSPKLPDHRALAGRWLGEVQVASLSANLQGRLPSREPAWYLRSLRESRDSLAEHHVHNVAMRSDDAAVFRRVVAHLDTAETLWGGIDEICAAIPRTLVHGDFVAKNARIRNTGGRSALIVFDWEFAGWGVPAADLAQLGESLVCPDLSVYSAVLGRAAPRLSLDEIQSVASCGSLFRLVDETRWAISDLKFGPRDYLLHTVEQLRFFEPALEKALEILKVVLA